ncbi:MAG: tRNA (adenosine(37)-N6)-threonylcarbamoyltransferase complex dimerization subunit type 1 TsaB [Defluviitaleaceae bacterium]|nr:tRNA (adenosine(37)-N6)-threonylcarbamoyltransferase complex dimerization subunit type 1 TsaB [Defluviitaleaceae bacterium]
MKILAIDTSGLQSGVAITDAGTPYICIGEITINARIGANSYAHSEVLIPSVEQLFKLTRLTPQDMDYIAYTNGPGSFTGLRIGASCSLAIAHSLNKPAIAVPTLDALAYNMLKTGGKATIIPMLDARRGQVYTAVYTRCAKGFITRNTDFLALPVEEFLPIVSGEQIIFLGDGADANRDIILNALPHSIFTSSNNNRQCASSAGTWAAEKIAANTAFQQKTEILYVRSPQAVRCLKL